MKRWTVLALAAALGFLSIVVFGAGGQRDLSAAALDTGFLDPSTNAADTGGMGHGFEINPEGAYSDGGSYAEAPFGDGDRHRYGGYGVSLPGGAAVDGIEVRADWWMDMGYMDAELCVDLSWDGGVSWTTQKCDFAMDVWIERTAVLGSSSDTWGHTWTTDELSNSNFLVRVQCWSPFFEDSVALDWIPVKVYYEGEVDTPTPTDTATPVPTDTPTPTLTATPAPTATGTPVPTATPTFTPTSTFTATPTSTATPTLAPTVHYRRALTATPPPTVTAAVAPTEAPSPAASPAMLPAKPPMALLEGVVAQRLTAPSAGSGPTGNDRLDTLALWLLIGGAGMTVAGGFCRRLAGRGE